MKKISTAQTIVDIIVAVVAFVLWLTTDFESADEYRRFAGFVLLAILLKVIDIRRILQLK